MKTLLVIFGISGDLSTRKLLPALGHIVGKNPTLSLQVLGISRRSIDAAQLVIDTTANKALAERTRTLTMDAAQLTEYARLKEAIRAYDAEQTLIYLSVPPGAAAQIVDLLGEAGINTPDIHLLFEKPFGFDTDTAKEFIQRTGRYFNESQLYRIDHYMAKEVAAEVIRRKVEADAMHRRDDFAHVEIIASETVGVEGRSVFYEQTGALRDFVQGHLLQLLALVLMDVQTGAFSLRTLPERRLNALRLLTPAHPERAVRAQYKEYAEEVGNVGSRVETYVRLELESTDPRWKGVPLTLVTGKNMARKQTLIRITYQDGSQIEIDEATIHPRDVRLPDAYERVLMGAIHDERYLFTTSAEILHAWDILAPLQQAWAMETRPLETYHKGLSLPDTFQPAFQLSTKTQHVA